MKASLYAMTVAVMVSLAACSMQEVKQATPAPAPVASQPEPPVATSPPPPPPDQNPAMTINKAGRKLNLVRIMDGAACKNEFEGAKGSFLIYADPNDIERIKRQQGTKVFSKFEDKIQAFSADVLQQAVNATNFDENPFALGKDETQERLAKELSANFQQALSPAIANFEQETSLTIGIAAYPPSLEFYQQGCKAQLNDDTPSAP